MAEKDPSRQRPAVVKAGFKNPRPGGERRRDDMTLEHIKRDLRARWSLALLYGREIGRAHV